MISKNVLARGLLLAVMVLPAVVQAKSFVVDSGADASSLGTSPAAACPSTSTLKCTLRAAIETAQLPSNKDAADSISIQVEGLLVSSQLPVITKSLSFTGALSGPTAGSTRPSHIARLASVPSGASSSYCELASSNATTSYRLFEIKPAVASPPLSVSFNNLNLCFGEVTAASGDTVIEDNIGGAIAVISSTSLTLNLTNVQLTDNHASIGGALAGYTSATTSVQVTGGALNRNVSAGLGGAVFIQLGVKSTLTVDGSQFSGNQATSGGALLVSGAPTDAQTVQIKNAVFDNNTATSDAGGAIRFAPAAASTLTLDNVRLLQNQGVIGGALSVDSAPHTATITNSSFAGNKAVATVTASSSYGGYGGAIYANLQVSSDTATTPDGTLTIIASTLGPYFAGSAATDAVPAVVDGNSATVAGGALDIADALLVMQRSFVVANSAPAGSALYFPSLSAARPASLAGNTIARNRQTGSDANAYAIYASSADVFPASASVPFIGNIIAENLDAASVDKGCLNPITTTTADNGGYNLFTDTHCASTSAGVQNQFVSGATIFWAKNAGYVTSTAGGALGGFVSRGLSPTVLPLVSESPAIDRMKSIQVSSNNLNLDARGAGIADGNLDGNAFRDIGAYEFGARGLVGFLTGSGGGYLVVEPSSGDTSVTIPVKNFGTATAPTVNALFQTVETSVAAQPAAVAPGTAQPDVSGTQHTYAPVPGSGGTPPSLSIAGGATNSSTSVVVHADSTVASDQTVKLLLSGLVDVDYDAASRTTTSFCLQPAGGTRYYPCVQETLTILASAGTTGGAINVSKRAFAFTGSGASSYTITLSSVPSQNVTIALASSQPGVTALFNGNNSVTFPAHGTNLARTITVVAANDPGVDASGAPLVIDAVISHTVTTTDPTYTGQAVSPVNVVVTGTGSSTVPSARTTGGGAFGWSTLLMFGSALLLRRRRTS